MDAEQELEIARGQAKFWNERTVEEMALADRLAAALEAHLKDIFPEWCEEWGTPCGALSAWRRARGRS